MASTERVTMCRGRFVVCVLLLASVAAVRAEEAGTGAEAPAPSVVATPTVLSYDDGTMEGKEALLGSGHVIFFDISAYGAHVELYLTKVEVFGIRYGYPAAPEREFTISVCDQEMKPLAEIDLPYSAFERGAERWYPLAVPSLRLPPRFYVSLNFRSTQAEGVAVGYDTSVAKSHSKQGIPGSPLTDVPAKFDWMVRLGVAAAGTEAPEGLAWRKPAEVKQRILTELKYDRGETDGWYTYRGLGYGVLFARPEAEKWFLEQVKVYGQRFLTRYDSEAVGMSVLVTDETGSILAQKDFPISAFPVGKGWAELELEPIEVPAAFYVILVPDVHRRLQLFIGYDETVSGHSKIWRSGSLSDPEKPLDWMIRALGSETPPGGE